MEVWNGLEFEEVKEKGWWGVNNYVKEWERVLKAVVREKGYDTDYRVYVSNLPHLAHHGRP